jgi:hypothetical protein
MSFGDLDLHGHFDILFLGVNRSGRVPGTSSAAHQRSYNALVHSVNPKPLGAYKNNQEVVVIIPHMCIYEPSRHH